MNNQSSFSLTFTFITSFWTRFNEKNVPQQLHIWFLMMSAEVTTDEQRLL